MSAPEVLPCGKPIAPSLVRLDDGPGLLVVPDVLDSSGELKTPAAVWCADHSAWHTVDNDRYEAYKAVTG